ncbi:hypothetical protein B0I35DRAFT_473649 [Stachybotrys elegans]|uniref:F-box domain-containing protein n=1 Tax=Stachybotrys elegans TaxID=80388 RepID=A0A8K0T2I3_9HYPO|nr:hypothetical protein B0I35DRAFT_473649 [Stachybotrys elegans]
MDYVFRLTSKLRPGNSPPMGRSSRFAFSSSHHNHRARRSSTVLTSLPYTIFIEIVSYLSAIDVLVCRRISYDVCQALTRNDLSISLILIHFPRSREGRLLRRCLQDDDRDALEAEDWAVVFARLTRRYFHLGNATPWTVDKIDVLKDAVSLRGVTPWNRFLRLDEKTAPFHYWEPVWTFSPADGLLVYPAPASLSDGRGPEYRARDLATGLEFTMPFDLTGKVVRRVRLNDGILIFEWCEAEAYHPLNDGEAAHRHFATAYDVARLGARDAALSAYGEKSQSVWAIKFRSEFKIHYLGLPLSHHDRFFSTHNRTHYVIYVWQPTRSPWGEDDPLERLIIWELGAPSPYRPSLDPGERAKPPGEGGPRIVRRLANRDLGCWGIQQKDTPSLRNLALDACTWDDRTNSACGHVYFTEEEHRWSAGPHSSQTPPRLHRVKSTGIPLIGEGPRWLDDCGGNNTTSNVNMTFCRRGPRRKMSTIAAAAAAAAAGSDDHEYVASETWPGRAPCWRHDDFPYLTVAEVFDASSGVRFSARHCFMLETLSVHIRPKLRVQGVEAVYARKPGSKVGSKTGSTASSSSGYESSGSQNQYGRAPGTSSSMSSEGTSAPSEGGASSLGKGGGVTRAEGPYGEEVQFADDMWSELMGKGFITGDERWLVGEDGNGDITVALF